MSIGLADATVRENERWLVSQIHAELARHRFTLAGPPKRDAETIAALGYAVHYSFDERGVEMKEILSPQGDVIAERPRFRWL